MKVLVERSIPQGVMQAVLGVAFALFSAICPAQASPPTAAWNALLQQHVKGIDDGHASQVDYAGMRRDHAKLDAYTTALSAATAAQFESWSRDEQKAFLLNAYNAFTIELVLTRWPKLRSIKDLGGLFSSPWKKKFFNLLGQSSDLDQIETRLRGKYADPRIHFALNCASISCPMLRAEAYVGDQLDHQLDDAMNRFLGDRQRNRYDPHSDTLQVSKIFDWYANDFRGAPYHSVAGLLALHAPQLSDDPKIVARLRAQQITVDYLPYDWNLNGLATP